jgi:ABC-type phosphate transport system permease subunit
VFLAESERNNRLAFIVRFTAKTLTGFPSILAGVFAYRRVFNEASVNEALQICVKLASRWVLNHTYAFVG